MGRTTVWQPTRAGRTRLRRHRRIPRDLARLPDPGDSALRRRALHGPQAAPARGLCRPPRPLPDLDVRRDRRQPGARPARLPPGRRQGRPLRQAVQLPRQPQCRLPPSRPARPLAAPARVARPPPDQAFPPGRGRDLPPRADRGSGWPRHHLPARCRRGAGTGRGHRRARPRLHERRTRPPHRHHADRHRRLAPGPRPLRLRRHGPHDRGGLRLRHVGRVSLGARPRPAGRLAQPHPPLAVALHLRRRHAPHHLPPRRRRGPRPAVRLRRAPQRHRRDRRLRPQSLRTFDEAGFETAQAQGREVRHGGDHGAGAGGHRQGPRNG